MTDAEATPLQRDLLDQDVSLYGQVLNTSRIYAHFPAMLGPLQALDGALATSGVLAGDLISIARLRVAQINGCPFSMDINAAGLLRSEEGRRKALAVESWHDSDVFSRLEKAVLAYAEALTRSDRDVDDELIDDLRSTLSDEAIVELTCWLCLENFYSKFNRAFRVESQGFRIIAKGG